MKIKILFGLMILLPSCQVPTDATDKKRTQNNTSKIKHTDEYDASTPSAKLAALKKRFKLTHMRVNSTDYIKVYRAKNATIDTLIGIGTNGEIFEDIELLKATAHPTYIARWALGIFISPQQRPTHDDGYLSWIKAPHKNKDVFEFYAYVDKVWMHYTWHPKAQKFTSRNMTQVMQKRHQRETTGNLICARASAYCGCWPSTPCFRADKLNPMIYPGKATHRILNHNAGQRQAYVFCYTYPCAHGECHECKTSPMPCTASCKKTPRPSDCLMDKKGYCGEISGLFLRK